MQTRVQKWGNSLGVRIPRGLAEEVGLGAGTEVSLSTKDGELVVVIQCFQTTLRHGERVVREVQFVFRLVPFVHWVVNDPNQIEAAVINHVELFADLNTGLTGQGSRRIGVATGEAGQAQRTAIQKEFHLVQGLPLISACLWPLRSGDVC